MTEGYNEKSIVLPSLISDGMVLQRNSWVRIWGKAGPGEKLCLTFLNKEYRTQVNEVGAWEIVLEELQPGGPYEMTIEGKKDRIRLRDVFIGDVWLLGGQSNMQLPVQRTLDLFEDEVKNADCPGIRRFMVPERYDFHGPADELSGGCWIPVTPASINDFSAVGYFFAKKIYEKYKVPIGLLHTAIGGTPAEAWISENTLKSFSRFDEILSLCKDDSYVSGIIHKEEARNNLWYQQAYEKDAGLHDDKAPWFSEAYDASGWNEMELPGSFCNTGLEEVKGGTVWFRKEISIPKDMLAGDAKLVLGTLIDADDTYVNGVQVGNTGYLYPPRRYIIPEGLLKEGRNVIAVRLFITQNPGAFVTDMPYCIRVNKKELSLSGTWKYRIGMITKPQQPTTFFQYKPAGVYNGMIYPLRKFSIKGILWYQGEANTGYPYDYKELFEAVIADWRALWNDSKLPFFYVQLPNYCPWRMESPESGWAMVREYQRQVLKVPGTGMAVTIDAGMYNDLHPWDKKIVGNRLALLAINHVFGENTVCSGPVYDRMEAEGGHIKLYFKHTGSGLAVKGEKLNTFEICGADGIFYPAEAFISGNEVIVTGKAVNKPVKVRYAWADNPEEANLYNKEGLPASPFITI